MASWVEKELAIGAVFCTVSGFGGVDGEVVEDREVMMATVLCL